MSAGLSANPDLDAQLARFRALFGALRLRYDAYCLLDSCGWGGETGGFYLMGFGAEDTLTLKGDGLWQNGQHVGLADTPEAMGAALHTQAKRTHLGSQTGFSWPFQAGWIGAMAYELAGMLEPATGLKPACDETVLGQWVRFAHVVLWHPESGSFDVVSDDALFRDGVMGMWQCDAFPRFGGAGGFKTRPYISTSMDESMFCKHVETLKDHIAQGDLYQANLSMRFVVPGLSPEALWELYLHLVSVNPSPFSGLFVTPEVTILSNSPERLVRGNAQTRRLDTRPIAGTRGRAKTGEEAQKIRETLTGDMKEQAEHRMLVDLERNDLGRVSAPASVFVSELGVLEQYSHVTHLVSQVEGVWAEGASPWDVLCAMFPGGTITGCPKIRCMRILSDLEPVPRGFYTGSLGYMDDAGNLDWNILIRSLFGLPDGQMAFHAGAGIVADSVGMWEHRECHRKAAAMEEALGYDHQPLCH